MPTYCLSENIIENKINGLCYNKSFKDQLILYWRKTLKSLNQLIIVFFIFTEKGLSHRQVQVFVRTSCYDQPLKLTV